MPLDLASCRAKLSRAKVHIETLEREIRIWSQSNPYSISKKTNEDFTRHSCVISILKQADRVAWSLIAGDAIHNLRSALDHLVYAIAVHQTNRDPPPGERILEFPICDTAKWFTKARTKLTMLSASVVDEIERFQPYNRTHKRLPPLLGMLRDFDDRDKHRLLRVVMDQPRSVEWKNLDTSILKSGESIEFVSSTAEVVDGTEIAAAVYPRSSYDTDYKIETFIVIAVKHRASPSGHTTSEVADVLGELVPEIESIIKNVVDRA